MGLLDVDFIITLERSVNELFNYLQVLNKNIPPLGGIIYYLMRGRSSDIVGGGGG